MKEKSQRLEELENAEKLTDRAYLLACEGAYQR